MARAITIMGAVGLVFACASPSRAQTHAPWPDDWNNWNDPALWVTVGDPGNAPDTRYNLTERPEGFGRVDYTYQIGKFEVTAGQYCEFLNAVARTDTYKLYDPLMTDLTNFYGCNIQRIGSPGSYTYSISPDWANRPVGIVSWGDAARFANWLTNGQPKGNQDLTTTEDGSYFLNGAASEAELMAVTRKGNARYVIPSEDEWYKAAYYEGGGIDAGYWDYPTGTNAVPSNELTTPDAGNSANFALNWPSGTTIGSPYWRTEVGEFENSPSPYGTFDQGGNVDEWNEAILRERYRGMRGGSFVELGGLLAWNRLHYLNADCQASGLGFRVAEVPEPATLSLLAFGGLALLRRRGKSHQSRSARAAAEQS